jgi:hypothetical protein
MQDFLDWLKALSPSILSYTGIALVFVLGLVAAAIRKRLEDWLKPALDAVEDTIYDRLLLARHTERCRSMISLIFAPQLSAVVAGAKSALELCVPPRLRQEDSRIVDVSSALRALYTTEAASSLFEPGPPGILVTGGPGIGKSMLLKSILMDQQGVLCALPGRPLPILISLRDFEASARSLQKFIEGLLHRKKFHALDRFVRRSISKGRFLLLFDGLDELLNPDVLHRLLHEAGLCRFVVTCRTSAYQGGFDECHPMRLEIEPFSDAQIEEFLAHWESDFERQGRSVHEFKAAIHAYNSLGGPRNPLILGLAIKLYLFGGRPLPPSRAALYREASASLMQRFGKRAARYGEPEMRQVLGLLAITISDSLDQKESYDGIDFLAARQIILREGDYRNTRELLDEIVHRTGFLLADRHDGYRFAHQTFREYFAADFLTGKPDELLKRWRRSSSIWSETVIVWCGLNPDSTAVIRAAYGDSNEPPLSLLLACVAEAQSVETPLADGIIDQALARVRGGIAEKGLQAPLAAIASKSGAAGLRVRRALAHQLSSGEEDHVTAAVADILALSGHPDIAPVIANAYLSRDYLRPAAERMGKLAVSALVSFIGSDSRAVIDRLSELQTREAVHALASLLWHPNELVAGRAAWKLASLLRDRRIEEYLSCYPVSDLNSSAPGLNWIWSPFAGSPSTPMSVIAGRIAWLLVAGPADSVPEQANCDPRLVIPLCAISFRDDLMRFDIPDKPVTWVVTHLTSEQQAQLDQFIEDGRRRGITSESTRKGARLHDERTVQEAFDRGNPALRVRQLVESLETDGRAELLRGVKYGLPASLQDWFSVFDRPPKSLELTWHYSALKSLTIALALCSLVGIAIAIFGAGERSGPLRDHPVLASLVIIWGIGLIKHPDCEPYILEKILLLGFYYIPRGLITGSIESYSHKLERPFKSPIRKVWTFWPLAVWFPFVLSFAGLVAETFLAWWLILPMWAFVVGGIAWLWIEGSQLDRLYRNPFGAIAHRLAPYYRRRTKSEAEVWKPALGLVSKEVTTLGLHR